MAKLLLYNAHGGYWLCRWAGLIPPTSGRAKVHGFDMGTEMSEIRKIIGICPQHDVLWDDLTVKEHLEFFAGLKGVPSDKVCGGRVIVTHNAC